MSLHTDTAVTFSSRTKPYDDKWLCALVQLCYGQHCWAAWLCKNFTVTWIDHITSQHYNLGPAHPMFMHQHSLSAIKANRADQNMIGLPHCEHYWQPIVIIQQTNRNNHRTRATLNLTWKLRTKYLWGSMGTNRSTWKNRGRIGYTDVRPGILCWKYRLENVMIKYFIPITTPSA